MQQSTGNPTFVRTSWIAHNKHKSHNMSWRNKVQNSTRSIHKEFKENKQKMPAGLKTLKNVHISFPSTGFTWFFHQYLQYRLHLVLPSIFIHMLHLVLPSIFIHRLHLVLPTIFIIQASFCSSINIYNTGFILFFHQYLIQASFCSSINI